MGRRKSGGTKAEADGQKSHGLALGTACVVGDRMGVDGEEMEENAESSNLDDSPLIGADNTSAGLRLNAEKKRKKDVVRTKTYQNVIYQNTFLYSRTRLSSMWVQEQECYLCFVLEQGQNIYMHEINDDIILPDKTLLFLATIEDAEYKEDKIECESFDFTISVGTMFLLPVWNNVYGFDMSCIRKQAMVKPLVDTFDPKQIVTSDVLVKVISITVDSYRRWIFLKWHLEISFSTGPRSKAAHWKQTVLYLDEVLTICEDEVINGSISVEPNKKNPQDLEITINYSLNGKRCQVSLTQHYKM
ncbi:hypothetical protein ZIOFF_034753 [Zingiber officinale]|uniref:Protein arginine N-methyltransferase domain-containing protein n=1 Tax=Zingiber officinale TaxID=94328 RepID=A0A8J5GF86_ZINOF|nr:hypothetical protein ZIOFF_034753 [Zingiber officinale]